MARRGGILLVLIAALAPALAGAQEETAALYARSCGKCHGTAEAFVYQSVTRSGEVLMGIETGMPVADYLHSGHGKLTAAEVAEMMAYFEALEAAQ